MVSLLARWKMLVENLIVTRRRPHNDRHENRLDHRASRGIGAACVTACAELGWAVAINYSRDEQAAPSVAARARGCGVPVSSCRPTYPRGEVTAMFERIDAELPPLHGLVNNAGVVDMQTRVDQLTLARIQRMFAINVFGTMLCAREAVRR